MSPSTVSPRTSPSKRVLWPNPFPFLSMHSDVLRSLLAKLSLSTASVLLAYWPVRWQRLVAARVSSPLISIKPGSPSPRSMVLLTMCFVSPPFQRQSRQRTNSEGQGKMQIAFLRPLAKTTGLTWCSSALAPNHAYKWQSTYEISHPYSPAVRSTDVVLGALAYLDGDRRW